MNGLSQWFNRAPNADELAWAAWGSAKQALSQGIGKWLDCGWVDDPDDTELIEDFVYNLNKQSWLHCKAELAEANVKGKRGRYEFKKDWYTKDFSLKSKLLDEFEQLFKTKLRLSKDLMWYYESWDVQLSEELLAKFNAVSNSEWHEQGND